MSSGDTFDASSNGGDVPLGNVTSDVDAFHVGGASDVVTNLTIQIKFNILVTVTRFEIDLNWILNNQ